MRIKSKIIRSLAIDRSRHLLLPLLATMLVSCAANDEQVDDPRRAVEKPVASIEQLQQSAAATAGLQPAQTVVASPPSAANGAAEPTLYRGNDRQVNLPAERASVRMLGKDVSLNFEDAPLSEVLHAVLGDILGQDYIVDGPVEGTVTLRTRTPVPRDQLLQILESLLKANGIYLISGSDGRYLVTSSQAATQLRPQISNPKTPGTGHSTIVVPLRYISASGMSEILQPVAPETAFVRVDNTRNLLMLSGTQAQLQGWLEMVRTFDVDLLRGMSVGMFPLEHSNVAEMAQALSSMLNSGAGGDESGAGQLVRIIPVKRLNSILVVTPRAHYLDSVSNWIKRLDMPAHASFARRLYVYEVQNTTASHLANLMTRIYSGSGSGGGNAAGNRQGKGQYGGTGGAAPGMSLESISGGGSSGSRSGSSSDVGNFSSNNKKGGAGLSSADLGAALGSNDESDLGDVRVVADEQNNSLMIYSSGRQYQVIEAALKQLDVVPTQVIIEASILEVTLTDDLRYGLEWTFKNGLGSNYDGVGELINAGDAIAKITPGFSYTVSNAAGDISAVLNALSSESLLNVISTPSVMVLDNHTAYIHVGDQIPVKLGTVTTDGGTTSDRFEYRDTGVKLNVRPSVNAGGLVTMDIGQSVTDIGGIDSATGQRTFLERNIQSRVAVRSNESVVLGGLIRESSTEGSSGLPWLHKLPVVGALFGTVEEEGKRTELLVIITPRAIYNESELRDVSQEMRARIRKMELIEEPPL